MPDGTTTTTRAGRPTKLTAEKTEELCDMLLTGAYIETAAAAVGINKDTLHDWLKRGARERDRRRAHDDAITKEREDDKERQRAIRTEERERRSKRDHLNRKARRREQRYLDFSDAVTRALADAELNMLAIITEAANGGQLLRREVRTDHQGNTTIVEIHAGPDFKAAKFRLERRAPERWAPTQRIEVSGNEEKPVALTLRDAVLQAHERRKERLKTQRANGASHPGANANGAQGANGVTTEG
jgi:transposase